MALTRSERKDEPKGRQHLAAAPIGAVTTIPCEMCGAALTLAEGTGKNAGLRVLICTARLGCKGKQTAIPAAVEMAAAGASALPGLGDDDQTEEGDVASATASEAAAGAEAAPSAPADGRSLRNTDGASKRGDRKRRLMDRAGDIKPGETFRDLATPIRPAPAEGRTLVDIFAGHVVAEGETPDLRMLTPGDIAPHPLNPRKVFDQAAIEELAASIREKGLLQPIVVRSAGDVPAGVPRWWIVAGERRWRASKLAEMAHIPAIVREMDDREHLLLALTENLARRDLDPLEEARGFAQLHHELGMKHEEIASSVGRNRSTVANAVRLLRLPAEIQAKISDPASPLAPSHGRALLRFESFPKVLAKIGELVAEKPTPSSSLEKGLPFARELVDAKLVLVIPGYNAPFDTTKCDACPFGAAITESYARYCLKPTHFRELKREADQARARTAEEQKAAAEARIAAGLPDDGPLDLTAGKEGKDFVTVYAPSSRPSRCPGSVKARIKSYGGGTYEAQVCLEVERHRAAVDLEKMEAEAERADRAASAMAVLDARVADATHGDYRPLVVLAGKAILAVDYYARGDLREMVGAEWPAVAAAIPTGYGSGEHGQGVKLAEALAQLSAGELVRLALRVILQPALGHAVTRGRLADGVDGLLDWYLPEAVRLAVAPPSDPALDRIRELLDAGAGDPDTLAYPFVAKSGCSACGGAVTVNGADEVRALTLDIRHGLTEGRDVALLCDTCPPADAEALAPALAVAGAEE